MRIDKMVKDKRILLKGEGFLAVVEYFQDTPARDNDTPEERLCSGLKEARKWLSKFPRDVWDGFARNESQYQELDERKRNGTKSRRTERGNFPTGEADRSASGSMRLAGRTLVGRM